MCKGCFPFTEILVLDSRRPSSIPVFQSYSKLFSTKQIAQNYTRTSRFTMLPHFLLFTILAPLALSVPVPSESVTPSVITVTSGASKSGTPDSHGHHMGINHANKPSWNLKIDKGVKTPGQISGTKSPSSLSVGTSGGTSNGTSSGTSSDGVASKELKEGGPLGEQDGDRRQEQVQSHGHGSGSVTDSASNTGNDGKTDSGEGTTTGKEGTTGGTTVGSEGTTGSDGTTTSTSKHK